MMATTNLSQNRAAQRLAKYRLAVATLARQAAIKAVKHRLRADGIKPHSLSMKEISTLADNYLAQHREQLVAEAKRIVATSPLFARWRLPVVVKLAETEHSPNADSTNSGVITND